jgi:hypothetical protein
MRSLQWHEKVLLYHKVSKMMRDLGSHIIATLVFKVCLMMQGERNQRVCKREQCHFWGVRCCRWSPFVASNVGKREGCICVQCGHFCCVLHLVDSFSSRFAIVCVCVCVWLMFIHNIQGPHLLVHLLEYLLFLVWSSYKEASITCYIVPMYLCVLWRRFSCKLVGGWRKGIRRPKFVF